MVLIILLLMVQQLFRDALFVITDKGLGAVSVVDDNEIMIGVLTDGDIRRGLSKGIDFLAKLSCY